MMTRPIVTLLTDFGTADGYVAEMKGVLLSSVPDVLLVDVSHDIAPQEVESARLALARYWRRFPPGTIHLVVVDPGVGSDRAALAIASDGRLLVGPDNGVLSPALLAPGARAVALPVPAHAAATFHGRDVFAPAAVQLAMGVPLDSLGQPADEPLLHRTPEPVLRPDGSLQGIIIAIDRFGNAITNCLSLRGGVVEVGGLALPVRHTYSDVERGAPVALVGSSGLVEIAVRDGNAARVLGLQRGTPIMMRPTPR